VLANEADRLGFDCNEGVWLMGWDKKTGLPLPETLKELGLEDPVKYLKK